MASQNQTWRGSQLLVEWRGERPQWEAAGILEMSPNQLSRYENGARPGDRLKARIAEKTEGAVPIDSWFEPLAEAG